VKKKVLVFLAIIYLPLVTLSQIGGDNTFEFLNLPNSARIAALGGNNISLYDKDLNMAYYNPALLRESMHNNLALNYTNYISDINYGYASYAYHFENIGTFAAGVYYMNYGDFIRANEQGEILGNFYAQEYSFNLYYARTFLNDSSLSVGGTLKTIYSALDHYYSSAMAIDAGVNYHIQGSNFSASAVITNLGYQLRTYSEDNREPLPLDFEMGITYRLPHAPFRFSLGAHNLFKWNMRYDSPLETQQIVDADSDTTANFGQKLGNAGDELLRHMILGVEIMPSDNFFIAFGYNYQRRTELALSNRPGVVGFSIGAGVKISKFMISYGVARYHMAGITQHVSITSDLDEFIRRN
jgi:hypothetical protein